MPSTADFGVFEMGMNHAGELAALTLIVRPHVAIVTTIAPAHMEYFGSEEAIADAKGEIFEGLEPGGTAIIPFDSPHHARLRAKAERPAAHIVSFSSAERRVGKECVSPRSSRWLREHTKQKHKT